MCCVCRRSSIRRSPFSAKTSCWRMPHLESGKDASVSGYSRAAMKRKKFVMTTTTNEIELEPLSQRTLGSPLLGSAWPFLGSVKVQVSVRVGGAEASVTELLELKQGSVLALDRLVDEPLDVLVDGHVVAR